MKQVFYRKEPVTEIFNTGITLERRMEQQFEPYVFLYLDDAISVNVL